MKLSAKAEYGVRMMVDIAAAHGQSAVPLSAIAEQEGISLEFLEQLAGPLRKQGLLESVRGPRGGYRLAGDPGTVTVRDVLWALEGPFIPMVCVEVDHEKQPECCSLLQVCTTRDVWVRLRDQVSDTLNAITLADLVRPKADHPAYTTVQPGVSSGRPAAPAAHGIPGRSKARRRATPSRIDSSEVETSDQR